MLAQRPSLAPLQEVADVAVGAPVLHRHLVAAPAAPDAALQQRRAVARHAARPVACILRVVVAQHGLDPLELGPLDVGRVAVLHDHLPLRHRAAGRDQPAARIGGAAGAGAAVDEGTGVGGVLQDRGDHAARRRPPGHLAEPVEPRHGEPAGPEGTQQLAHRAQLQEAGEDQADPLLHLAVRVLRHHTMRAAYQARRQEHRQLAAFGLAQQAGGQAAAQRVQLDLGDRSFQAQEKAAVGRVRVVHAVAVADEALPIATQVQQRVPVGAIPRQPGDFVGEDDADLAEGDARDQILEPLALQGRRTAAAEVAVDHLDIGLEPAEFPRALAQRVLQPQALLVAQHLLRRGLADVDHRLAAQVPGRHELRRHGSPPVTRREDADAGSASSPARAAAGASTVAGRLACPWCEARRTRSRMASSDSLLDGGHDGAGARLVARIGTFSRTSPRYTT